MHDYLFINAFFEEEFHSSLSLLHYITKHPVSLQLHYLSLLLAQHQTALLAFPIDQSYAEILKKQDIAPAPYKLLAEELPVHTHIHSWGSSLALQAWAKERSLLYTMPSWDLVRRIHAKDFVATHTTRLLGSSILSSHDALDTWLEKQQGPCVLKTPLLAAGRGHLLLSKETKRQQAHDLFTNHGLLIAEPWVDRILDFSTQWELPAQGSPIYLGATICENTKHGGYLGSVVGPESILFGSYLPFVTEHLIHAKALLTHIQALGFFGSIGFDAFIYRTLDGPCLQPIVELNARKTMGWVALQLHKQHPWSAAPFLRIRYTADPCTCPLLPRKIFMNSSFCHLPKTLSWESFAFNPQER